ncbi:hypothetical protein SCHPADRAFT_846776 [Schizopora paradoxa]|uniref:SP-RING-type domain-containing protein n=1 Tax=Schizopora paradoxa TaxID=27342 RepID=A0A0H2SJK7_9AGAM|nr:hypothetical protein SCHPADRAFT_846776 [Schizopora paradoxa]
MPTIRNRRSRARREPSSDRIEEDPTQDENQEDVDENGNASEEEQPRRRGSAQQKPQKKVKKEKTRRSARTQDEDGNEEGGDGAEATAPADNNEEEVDEGAWLDLDNFKNQPLSRQTDGLVIAGIAKEWDRFVGNWERSAMTMAPQVAEAMAEVGEGRGNEKDLALKELEKMDIKMREFVDTAAEIQAHYDMLLDIRNQVAREDTSDVLDLYNDGVQKKKEEWAGKTTRQKLISKNDSPYQLFRQRIYEVQHPGEAMPPMTEFISREEGDDSDDEDLAVGGVSQNFKCTLTLLPMEKPLRSRVCKHVFSEDGIRSYFADGKRKTCPGAGCSREQMLSDYVPDNEFVRQVKAYVRREKRMAEEREDDDDDTEVIE